MKEFSIVYKYLFYFFYRSINNVKGNILIKPKAIFMLLILKMILFSIIFVYYSDYTRNFINLSDKINYIYTALILLTVFTFWYFERKNNWRMCILEFDKWPEKKRKKWDLFIKLFIFFVFANFVFSFYIMSEIDWKNLKK